MLSECFQKKIKPKPTTLLQINKQQKTRNPPTMFHFTQMGKKDKAYFYSRDFVNQDSVT